MTYKRIAVIVALVVVIISGFLTARWLVKPPSPKIEGMVIEVVAQNLVVPWAIDFLPDGRMIFTERGGRISVIAEDIITVAEIEVATIGEGGLLGIAVDPEFGENSFVYAYYTYTDNGDLLNKVVRFKMMGLELIDETVILDKIPGARFHNGGRIKFGTDDKLYITTGDASEQMFAQDVYSLVGKILRINKDSSIPEANPFGNEVYSYGHRNPQGLAWHPVSGELYAVFPRPIPLVMRFILTGTEIPRDWPGTRLAVSCILQSMERRGMTRSI
jgi:glucose/arabinose dehydrogenase